MSYITQLAERRPVPLLRASLAVALAFMLGILSIVGVNAPARAATPGLTAEILLDGAEYAGTPVVGEGATLTLKVQYNKDVVPGSTVVFDMGTNVEVNGVPSGNTAIESITQDGNKVQITFKDPWPSGVDQGLFDLTFKIKTVEESTVEKLTWSIDETEESIDVIIKNGGDDFANVTEGFSKGVSSPGFDSLVRVVDGVVTLDPAITEREITYTLRVDSPEARTGYSIADQLPKGLSYVPGSFTGSIVTWDDKGLNQRTDPFAFAPTDAGDSFQGNVDIPGPSRLSITYKVKVTDPAALTALLQAKYAELGGVNGNFSIDLTNTATFGDSTTKTAKFTITGKKTDGTDPIPGISLGSAFAKEAPGWTTPNVVVDEDGKLETPADITYSLTANLSQWDGRNEERNLTGNVVISDVLDPSAVWNTEDEAFITATGITLASVVCTPETTVAEFAGTEAGSYCVAGQTLLVNVGKDKATTAQIWVKAKLVSVAGLGKGADSNIEGAKSYRLPNDAKFTYNGKSYTGSRSVDVVVLPDSSDGLNDKSVFTKAGIPADNAVNPGEAVVVNYTFKVAAGKGVDVSNSYIIDYIDSDTFDLSDLSKVTISGTYAGSALAAADFTLSVDDDGNLKIALSDTGKALVASKSPDQAYQVNLSLTTTPFDGKETKEIKNKATLFGEDEKPVYWSKTETESTSYGDEAEVRKRVYDADEEEWVETLNAYMDGKGNLVQDKYVYRIEFIPHGKYDKVAIVPVHDVLPASVEFLGFVTEENAATGTDPAIGPTDIGGNLEVTWDAEKHQVSITQKTGTKLNAGGSIAAYVAVQITDASKPIINKIGTTSATIVPTKSVSVGDRVWLDVDRDGRQTDVDTNIPGVVLNLVGPDGKAVTDVFGKEVLPTTTGENGWYTFNNLPALEGDQVYTVRIDREASAEVLKPYIPTKAGVGSRDLDSSDWEASTQKGDLHDDGMRDPTLDFGFIENTFSIGDYVWFDVNRDGQQTAGEPFVPKVKVNLYVKDGNDLLLMGSTETGDKGYYSFTDLDPAKKYVVEFVKPDGTTFTSQNVGDDKSDSDADPQTGLVDVVNPEGRGNSGEPDSADDPTIDAGLVKYNLVLEKELEEGGPYLKGATATFTLTPKNEGPVDALAGWSVTDLLPAELTLESMSGEGYTCDVSTATCVAEAPLKADTSGNPITVTATVNANITAKVRNLAYVSPSEEDAPETNPLEVPAKKTDTKASETDNDAEAEISLDALVSIGDFVWIDVDRDGVQDADEPVVKDMTVNLYDESGKLIATTKTDKKGFYSFTDLTPGGEYTVEFVKDPSFSFTSQNSGTDDTADSDADVVTGRVTVIAPIAGNNSATEPDDPTIDAGLVKFNLSVTKTLITKGDVYPGSVLEFRLLPHNDGPTGALGGWSVTDVLPDGLTLKAMAGDGYTCDIKSATCVNDKMLAAGADGAPIIVTATVDADAKGDLRNIAYVSPAYPDLPETNPLEVPGKDTDTKKSETDNDDEAPIKVKPEPALAKTGGSLTGLWIALGLVGLGGGLIAVRRKEIH